MQLEEGEISDDSEGGINPYTPLERPPIALEKPEPIKVNIDIDEESVVPRNKPLTFGSSDSDSDDSYCNGKKMRITSAVPKKYSIWNKDPNELLTDVMDKIGMESPENDRNVENYPLPRAYKREKPQAPRKRKIPTGKRDGAKEDILHPDAKSKELKALSTTDENTFEEVADDIAINLNEHNQPLILKIVTVIGKIKAIELYEQTKEIESDGGMLVVSGTRKRTSGGIFIYLVRNDKDITGLQRDKMFEDNKPINARHRKKHSKDKNKQIKDQITLSNPPPSPDPEGDNLPSLPLRQELISYDDLFMV